MAAIILSDPDTKPERTHREVVTVGHFGINLVASAIPSGLGPLADSGLGKAIAGLFPGTLRYPGGTVIETVFDMARPGGPGKDGTALIPQSDAFALAAATGAALDIVLPTRDGLDSTAAEALRDSTYGQRGVNMGWLDALSAHVAATLREASVNGVRIASFEIGNEFWLGAEMTATEYGRLARAMLATVQATIDATLPAGAPEPALLVQSLTSAGLYSPKDGTPVWISGDQVAFTSVAGWQRVVMPGQGSAAEQALDIADQITGAATGGPNLAGLVDGLVAHDYNTRGHRTPGDAPLSYMFSQFDRQEARLGLAPGSLSRHVTEWNAKSLVDADGDGANDATLALNRGLPHAGLLVEMFYQMVARGIDAAAIWPTYFPAADTTNLLASADYGQRIPGAMFALMRESLPGTSAAFDSHDPVAGGQLDTFGFVSPGRLVILSASRAPAPLGPLTLDLDAVGEKPLQSRLDTGRYFVVTTELQAVDAGGRQVTGVTEADARPVLLFGDGIMATGDDILLPAMGPYGMVRVEVTFVNDAANRVEGRGGADLIEGLAGNDTLLGADGADTLLGGSGADLLAGGSGNDSLSGGLWGDTLLGEDGQDTLLGGNADDVLDGGGGDDLLWGEAGHDRLDGGAGNDRLWGGAGSDIMTGGTGADAFVFANGFGQDRITDFDRSAGDFLDLTQLSGRSDITGFAQVAAAMSVQGDDLVLALRAGTLTIEGGALQGLSAADVLF